MQFTQLEYFIALAHEQHFGRAAAACYVSPSALSEAIRKLEIELGAPLVRRGRVYEGLTPEGEAALVWARRVLASEQALRDGLAAARDGLATQVRFGVIPSAVTRAAALLTALAVRHPLTRVQMLTGLTSEEIIKRLRRYELDAGLLHPSIDDVEGLALTPLHEEEMVVVGLPEVIPTSRDHLTGSEVSALPLCLLEPGMRARQLLDLAYQRQGITLTPRIEADSVEGLLALTRAGGWAAVVPRSTLPARTGPSDLHVARMIEPSVVVPISLARLADEPRPPIAAALEDAIQRIAAPCSSVTARQE